MFKGRKWIKGRFLGIAWSTGDKMCYKVQVDEDGKRREILHQSIVLPRHLDENGPKQILEYSSNYYFPTPIGFDKPDEPLEERKRDNQGSIKASQQPVN